MDAHEHEGIAEVRKSTDGASHSPIYFGAVPARLNPWAEDSWRDFILSQVVFNILGYHHDHFERLCIDIELARSAFSNPGSPTMPRGRGRPRKYPLPPELAAARAAAAAAARREGFDPFREAISSVVDLQSLVTKVGHLPQAPFAWRTVRARENETSDSFPRSDGCCCCIPNMPAWPQGDLTDSQQGRIGEGESDVQKPLSSAIASIPVTRLADEHLMCSIVAFYASITGHFPPPVADKKYHLLGGTQCSQIGVGDDRRPGAGFFAACPYAFPHLAEELEQPAIQGPAGANTARRSRSLVNTTSVGAARPLFGGTVERDTQDSDGQPRMCHCCPGCVADIVAYFSSLISKGVVLDRVNSRDLQFICWLLCKGCAIVKSNLQAPLEMPSVSSAGSAEAHARLSPPLRPAPSVKDGHSVTTRSQTPFEAQSGAGEIMAPSPLAAPPRLSRGSGHLGGNSSLIREGEVPSTFPFVVPQSRRSVLLNNLKTLYYSALLQEKPATPRVSATSTNEESAPEQMQGGGPEHIDQEVSRSVLLLGTSTPQLASASPPLSPQKAPGQNEVTRTKRTDEVAAPLNVTERPADDSESPMFRSARLRRLMTEDVLAETKETLGDVENESLKDHAQRVREQDNRSKRARQRPLSTDETQDAHAARTQVKRETEDADVSQKDEALCVKQVVPPLQTIMDLFPDSPLDPRGSGVHQWMHQAKHIPELHAVMCANMARWCAALNRQHAQPGVPTGERVEIITLLTNEDVLYTPDPPKSEVIYKYEKVPLSAFGVACLNALEEADRAVAPIAITEDIYGIGAKVWRDEASGAQYLIGPQRVEPQKGGPAFDYYK